MAFLYQLFFQRLPSAEEVQAAKDVRWFSRPCQVQWTPPRQPGADDGAGRRRKRCHRRSRYGARGVVAVDVGLKNRRRRCPDCR